MPLNRNVVMESEPEEEGRSGRFRVRPGRFRVKRFRPRRKEIRLVHLLPNILTCLNIACGVCAIILGHEGKYETAASLILLAGFFDMVDGKVARLIGSGSPFGVQLDSLADVVSFGVAPPILIHALLFQSYNRLSLVLVLVYTLCTALRLARYNVSAIVEQKRDHFTGLPCPVPACFIAALVLVMMDFTLPSSQVRAVVLGFFGYSLEMSHPAIRVTLHAFMVILACLMVSTIPYPDLSAWQVERRNIYQHTVIMVLLFCVSLLVIKYAILFLTAAFIVSGPALALHEMYHYAPAPENVEETKNEVKLH